jgi:subtilisin family serine protease
MALGGPGGTNDLRDAIRAAIEAGVVIVAASGNEPDNSSVAFPAAYPGVVAAAGVDRNGNHADLSVAGPQVVLAAPAVDIVTAGARGSYVTADGTSAATAIIAGVAALVRAKYPNLSAAEVVHRLTATAIDRGPPGRDDQYGFGIVNPVAALTAAVPPLTPSATTAGANSPPSAANTPRAAPAGNDSTALITTAVCILLAACIVGFIIIRRKARH